MRGNRPGFRPQAHTGAQHHNPETGGETATQERPNVTHGEASPRMFPGEIRDLLYLSERDKEEYSIQGAIPSSLVDTAIEGDKVYCAMRDPSVYGGKEPGHARRVKMKWNSFKLVIDPATNKPVNATDDTVFYTVDRKEYMEHVARHNDHTTSFTDGVIKGGVQTQEAQDGLVENFRGNDPDFISRKYQESHEQLAAIKEKWPPGMSIEQIEQHMGVERTKQIERNFARGGRTERPGEYTRYEEALREKNSKKQVNKSVSFPGQATK